MENTQRKREKIPQRDRMSHRQTHRETEGHTDKEKDRIRNTEE